MASHLESEKLYFQYLQMGKDRTLPKLASITGRSLSSLQKLSYRNKWKERILHDNKTLEQHSENIESENLSVSEMISDISEMTLDKLHRAVKTLEPKNMRDARLLLDIHNLVSNKPTEITQTNPGSNSSDNGTINLVTVITETLPPEWAEKLLNRLDEIATEKLFHD